MQSITFSSILGIYPLHAGNTAHPFFSFDNQICIQTLPDILMVKIALVENHSPKCKGGCIIIKTT